MRAFGAVVLTGPRRSGKTFLLRDVLPKAPYLLFEDPDVIARFRSDPQGFLDDVRTPVILDEVQNVPELFGFVRSRIDRNPKKKGQYLLTGSQESSLMKNVSESMAGRAAILHLLPFSLAESPKVTLLRGGFPEVVSRPSSSELWFASYLQTYLERDVRQVSVVQDLPKFRRFMALLATRHGATLNKADLAAPLGMSIPGIGNWIDILEATGLIVLVQPYFENMGKRIIKAPKVYWVDSGLVCYLLGIRSASELERSPFLGALFEGFVASELLKAQVARGRRKELYYFRDQQGLEVDFLVPELVRGKPGITLCEVKASRTPTPEMAKGIQALQRAWRSAKLPIAGAYVVHRSRDARARRLLDAASTSEALVPSVKAVTFERLVELAHG